MTDLKEAVETAAAEVIADAIHEEPKPSAEAELAAATELARIDANVTEAQIQADKEITIAKIEAKVQEQWQTILEEIRSRLTALEQRLLTPVALEPEPPPTTVVIQENTEAEDQATIAELEPAVAEVMPVSPEDHAEPAPKRKMPRWI